MTDFSAVDTGDARELVAMMDATDAWPAVRVARAWVLEQVELSDTSVVVDVGCGPGTFGGSVRGFPVDIDMSRLMVREVRRRRPDARVVLGDAARLPLRDGSADLVRAERVLQWISDPTAALKELHRITAPGGWLAVTDTDWGTLTVGGASEQLAAAALGWVPHPRFARALPKALSALGARDVMSRTDRVVLIAWDPDTPGQHDGPPGLPLHSIAGGGPSTGRAALDAELVEVAERARSGEFTATLDLVTVVARRDL